MKKTLILASLFAVGISNVNAEPAVIITDFQCAGIDGNGGSVSTTNSKVVITNSKNGVVNFKCHFSEVPNDTGKAVHHDYDSTGALCSTLTGSTDDWKMTVGRGGNAVLSCRVHP